MVPRSHSKIQMHSSTWDIHSVYYASPNYYQVTMKKKSVTNYSNINLENTGHILQTTDLVSYLHSDIGTGTHFSGAYKSSYLSQTLFSPIVSSGIILYISQ